MYIYLNPQYSIRNEKGCSYIITIATLISEKLNSVGSSVSMIPPMVGYILSHLEDDEIEASVSKIAEETHIQKEIIDKFVKGLIENPQRTGLKFNGHIVEFPPYLLIASKSQTRAKIYTATDFGAFEDFTPQRPSVPLSINFMITTKCHTNCIYCYADRNRKDDMSVDDVLRVLKEAYEIGVVNLTLSGGDVLAFPEWRRVVEKVNEYQFSPILSSKVPLNKQDVVFLKKTGLRSLQVSLDAITPETLAAMVQVKTEYVEMMKDMLRYCDEVGLKVNIRTVLTKYNSSELELTRICELLCSLNCVSSWVLTPAFYSEFRNNYQEYRASDDALIKAFNITKSMRSVVPFGIYYNKMNDKKYTLKTYTEVDDFVENNQICHANSYSMAIISDGTATVCEMLYENPNFKFGTVRNQSLCELWNSNVALSLYSYKQEMIKQKTNNPCVTCDVYNNCKLNIGKRVCYVDITKVYGRDKYEYPDPRCPRALSVDETFIL